MIKRALALGLTMGLAVAAFTSCGGASKTPLPVLGSGTLFSFVGDAPLCDVLTFRVPITGLTLKRPDGGGATVLSSASASIKVNLAALKEFSTVLNVASIPEGTYNQATISFGPAQMIVYDPTQDPPVKTVSVAFSNARPTVNIQPALTVTNGQVIGLKIDFDLRHSIDLDSAGQVTGNVTPVMTMVPVTPSGSQGFGEMDDVLGFIERVDTFSANPSFVGDFAMQLLSGTGPSLVVNLTGAILTATVNTGGTGYQVGDMVKVTGGGGSGATLRITAVSSGGAAAVSIINPGSGYRTTSGAATTAVSGAGAGSTVDINQLLPGSFVEVDGFVDTNGNFVANSVDVEDQEVVENHKIALLGYVTSVTRDSGGNLTQFNLYVREEEPDDEFDVNLDSVVVVKVSSPTVYQFSSRPTNFAGLSFDSTAINVGQELVVHGVITKASAPQPTLDAADAVYLKLQSHEGRFSSLVQAGSDDKTGAFDLAPCATLFQGTPIMVFTSSRTGFVNVNGLNELTAQPPLVVKGLLFFEAQGTTINGVTVPAGTYVLLAKQVHALI